MTDAPDRKRWLNDREYEVGNEPAPDRAHADHRETVVEQAARALDAAYGPVTDPDDTLLDHCRWTAGVVVDAALTAGWGPVAQAKAERDRLRDEVMGHRAMKWPEEAHRLQQQRNEWRARADRTEERLAAVVEAMEHALSLGNYVRPKDVLALARPEGGSDDDE